MVCLWFFFMPFAPPEATGSATGSATLSSPPKEPPPPPEVPMPEPEPEAVDGTDVTDLGEVMDTRPGKHTKSYGIDGP